MKLFLYFYNSSNNSKYLEPVEIMIKQLCSKGIYDHVEGGIARYTVDENWTIHILKKCFMTILNLYCYSQNTVN